MKRIKKITQQFFSPARKQIEHEINLKPNKEEGGGFQRKSDKPVLVVSGQKTGTHLLMMILENMGFTRGKRREGGAITPSEFINRNPKEYLFTHLPPSRETYALIAAGEIKTIFNYRDPRDVIVSNYYWTEVVIEKDPASPEAQNIREFRRQIQQEIGDKQKSFQLMILNYQLVPGDQGLDTWFRETIGLFLNPVVFKTQFESLVGPNGGGEKQAQRELIDGLLSYLNVNKEVDEIIHYIFSKESKTFRSGKIGSHREEFSDTTKELFDKYYGDVLDIYGYDK